MKSITNIAILLIFTLICLAIPYFLPLWMVLGIMLMTLFSIISLQGSSKSDKNDKL